MLLRRLAQIGSAILYNANIISDIPAKYINSGLCVLGMNCMYCPAAVTGCPLGMTQRIFSGGLKRIPLGIIACLLLFGLLFGRLVCSWLCPFGLLQDMLDKAPLPKIKKSRWTRWLSYLKYVIGIVFVIVLPLLYFYTSNKQVQAFCQNLCPVNALTMELFTMSVLRKLQPVHTPSWRRTRAAAGAAHGLVYLPSVLPVSLSPGSILWTV